MAAKFPQLVHEFTLDEIFNGSLTKLIIVHHEQRVREFSDEPKRIRESKTTYKNQDVKGVQNPECENAPQSQMAGSHLMRRILNLLGFKRSKSASFICFELAERIDKVEYYLDLLIRGGRVAKFYDKEKILTFLD